MIPVTPETKTALQQAVKQIRAQISWAISATETQTITSEDQLVSMKKEAEGYYCKSTLRKITIVVAGTDINLLDKKITAQVQVKTGADTWGTISWGSFTITEAKVDEDKGSTTFTGYGGIALLQAREYNTGELSFPTTVGGLARQVADKFGIVLNPELKILPPEYQRVTYIEGNDSGNTCIDTGWVPGLEFTIKVRASIQTTAQTGSRCYLFGVTELQNGATRESDLVMSTADSNEQQPSSSVRWYNSEDVIKYATVTNKPSLPRVGAPFDVEVISTTSRITQNLTVGGNTATFSNDSWTGGRAYSRTMYLGALHHTNTAGYYNTNHNIRIFGCQIYDGGTLIRDYLPCRRKSDSKPGLYDLINGAFYPNAGTGEFTLGTDTDGGLPAGYQQVDYIQKVTSNTNDVGLVDFVPTINTELEVEFSDIVLGQYNAIMGSALGGSSSATRDSGLNIQVVAGTGDNGEFRLRNLGVSYAMTANIKSRHTIALKKDGMYFDGERKFTDRGTAVPENQFLLFAINRPGTPPGVAASHGNISCKLYRAKIWDDGVLVRDLVPCIRESDGASGFYDLVNDNFVGSRYQYSTWGTGAPVRKMPNLDAPINEDLWANISGTTYRDILEEIAGATGTIAVIGGGDDTLDLKLPPINEAEEELTENNLITAKIGENWGKVSSVVLSRQPQNDNVEVTDQEIANAGAGKNIFPGWVMGIRINPTTGHELAYNTGAVSDFIPVDFGKNPAYRVSGVPDDLYKFVAAYDRNKHFLGRTNAGAWTTNTLTGDSFVSGTRGKGEIKYLRASIYEHSSVTGTIDEVEGLQTQIEAGETATTYEPFIANGRVDLTIANNEILDKQRETTAQPILDAVKGWEYRNAEIKTEGHGYHEIGDRLDLTVGGTTYPTIVTKSTIQVDGGIKETLTSATPAIIPIDYAKSGGIAKTVFRTELTVDKQAQEIESIVSRQDATDAAVQEQFTQVTQNLTNIIATVQSTGGGNIIKNSVGYGKDADGILTIWQYGSGASATTVRSQSSPASLNAGAQAGYEIMLTGASTISQPVELTPGETYTLALRAQKGATGSAIITVGNSSESKTITLAANTAYTWQRQSVEFTPTMGANTVTITAAAGTTVEITDLILATGGAITWRQASSEIYNTQVSLDQGGVQVRSSVYTGDYVEITPLEFAGYSNAGGSVQKVFSLNRDTTEVEKLEARSQIKMPPLKIVPINSTSHSGWAFVKED